MSVRLAIHPSSHSLPMYGSPEPNSAYSLSGHVSISLSSPFSIFDGRRTARLLLKSLTLNFEGQSEMFTPDIGYSGMRLCSITREIAPREPLELSNEGNEHSGVPCLWNVIFNLPIPGWLPETSNYGLEELGVKYTLYASAKFVNLDDGPTNWGLATLCAAFRSRTRTIRCSMPIVLKRFIAPPTVEKVTPSPVNFLVNSTTSTALTKGDNGIPADILSKIQVLVAVPEYVGLDDYSIPLTLRLRTKNMDESDCKRLRVTEVCVDLLQNEKYRHKPSTSYTTQYPLPPRSMQPPTLCLPDPHPISTVYDVGLFANAPPVDSVSRSFSLLPNGENGLYEVADNNYIFANDAENPALWYTMEISVPYSDRSYAPNVHLSEAWAGPAVLRPSYSAPQLSIRHELAISMTCSYDALDGESSVARQRLSFSIPLKVVAVAPSLPARKPPPPSAVRTVFDLLNIMPMSAAPRLVSTPPGDETVMLVLPAYSQLYDENGDRKIDYSIPLPLYTPKCPADAVTSCLSEPRNPGWRKEESPDLLCPMLIDVDPII